MAVGDIISRSCEQMVNGKLCSGELRVSEPIPGFTDLPEEIEPNGDVTVLQGVTCSACGAFYHYDPELDRLSRLS
ncbi:MAG TPA: hypothetical protein VH701_23125 [Vicinamibacterales bacterium]|jgi:hypothetical protein